MTSRNTRWVAMIAVTALVLYLCWLMIAPFIDVILWAAVMAIVSHPLYKRFLKRGWSTHWAAMATTLIVVLVVLVPLILVGMLLVQQGIEAAEAAKVKFEQLMNPNSAFMQWLRKWVDVSALSDPKKFTDRFGDLSKAITVQTLGFVGGVFKTIIQLFLVLFTLYYLLRDANRIVPAVRESLPIAPERAREVFQRTQEVIIASLNGVLAIAAVQGLLGIIGFVALGLPSPVVWGVVMFVLCTIPMAGSVLVWGPASLYFLAMGDWVRAIMMAAWGGLVISMIDNFLRPRWVGQRAKLHEVVILFAVLGGLSVFGVLGIVIGPVVAAIGLGLVDVLRQSNLAATRSLLRFTEPPPPAAQATPPAAATTEKMNDASIPSPETPAQPDEKPPQS